MKTITPEIYEEIANKIVDVLNTTEADERRHISLSDSMVCVSTDGAEIEVEFSATAYEEYEPGDYWTPPYCETVDHDVSWASLTAYDDDGEVTDTDFDFAKLKELF